jgi:hypothetical protein
MSKRAYELDSAIAFLNQYLAVDKNGNTEAEKIAVQVLYIFSYLRFGSGVSLLEANNPQTINFSSDFGTDNYALLPLLTGADGRPVTYTLGALSSSGFEISVDFDCTLSYIALKGSL